MNKTRIKWIDAARGFAIICVVIGHIINGYMSAGLFPEHRAAMHTVNNAIYSFHMPLFFVISGYLFADVYLLYDSFGNSVADKERLKHRIINLFILYTVHSVVYGFMKMLFSSFVNHEVRISDVLLIWIRPLQLYWFLYILIVLYMLFSISLLRNLNPEHLLVLLFFLSVVSGFLPGSALHQVRRVLFNMFFFHLGICVYRGNDRIRNDKLHWTFLGFLSAVGFALMICYWRDTRYLYAIPIVNTIVATSVSLLFLMLFYRIKALSDIQVLRLCGRYSLEIYLFHTYFFSFFRSLFREIGFMNFGLNVMCNAVLSILLSILAAKILKALKLYDLFFKPYDCLIERRQLQRQTDKS